MSRISYCLWTTLLVSAAARSVCQGQDAQDEPKTIPLEDNMCVVCHGESDLWEGDTAQLYVPVKDLENDVHWQKGIQCHHCHGGDPESTELREAHASESGFRKVEKPAEEPAFCGRCHADSDYMTKAGSSASASLIDNFLNSVHGQHLQQTGGEQAATCSSCHAKHGMRAVDDPESAVYPSRLIDTCGHCHDQARSDLLLSDHRSAGEEDAQGVAGPLSCQVCHHEDPHAILPVDNMQSPVFVNNQVRLCGECHEEPWQEYRVSVHGHGLEHAGLLKTAVCADCHSAHAILSAEHAESTLHETRVAHTCGKCHRFIEERLRKSVHGLGVGPGGQAPKAAPGGTVRRTPSCTDCHAGHDLPDPRSPAARNQQADRCGNCHTELQTAYRLSMHGALSDLGYTAGAKCSDCHGAHDILPLDDPQSRMAPGNRIVTCARCHEGISPNLASFDPHANQHDRQRSALVFWVYRGVLAFIIVVFGFFGVHSIFWFVRGLIDVRQHGRPQPLQPDMPGFTRFTPFHRVAHTVMVVSFLGLALTGLPLKFSNYAWAQWLAVLLGGFESTGLWHRVFSITTFGCFGAYAYHLLKVYRQRRRDGVSRRETIFGPDSPVPNRRDASDMIGMLKWFVGRGPRPTFERWAYWEKFDFFGATSDIILIGTTGLILWFPNWFCSFLPGEAVNIAKVVHSTLALLATGFVFAIHFFGTHFRADKFPMDMSILTGVVSESEMEHERPELLTRLQQEGRLQETRSSAPSRSKLCAVRIAGFVALFVGLAALAGIIWSLIVV